MPSIVSHLLVSQQSKLKWTEKRKRDGAEIIGANVGNCTKRQQTQKTEVQCVRHNLYNATTAKGKGIGEYVQTYSVPPPLLPPRSCRASQRAPEQAKTPLTSQRAAEQATSQWVTMPPTSQRAAERANELMTSQNAPMSQRAAERANELAINQNATVAHSSRGEVQKARNVNGLYRRLAYVRRTTGMDNIANGQQIVRCALSAAGPPPQRIAGKAHEACARAYSSTTCARRNKRNWRLTVKTNRVTKVVMVPKVMMVMATAMVVARARESMLMLWAGDQPTWGLLSSLSKPHDQPYPMQPYATKPS